MSTLAIALAAHLDKTNPEDTKPNITPETVIETKMIENKLCATTWCVKDQAAIALAMLKEWEKPVMNIERYPALAWEIPQKYFDKVKEGFFWEEWAKQYKKYAEYFSSLVVEWKEGYISGYLLAVFNNPWKESTYQRFLKKLNKKLKPWKTIDENKLTKMLSILDEMWIRLKTILDSQELELSDIKKDISDIRSEWKELKSELKELKSEWMELESEWKELESELKELKSELKELESEWKKLESELKELKSELKELELKWKELELKWKELELKWKELKLKWKELKSEWKELKSELKELELEWKELELTSIRLNKRKRYLEAKIKERWGDVEKMKKILD